MNAVAARRLRVIGLATGSLLALFVVAATGGSGAAAIALRLAAAIVAGALAWQLLRGRSGRYNDAASHDHTDAADRRPADAAASIAARQRAVARTRDWCGAVRVVLWSTDRDADTMRSCAWAGRRPPATLPRAGNPLVWAERIGTPMRLEPVPDWTYEQCSMLAVRVPVERGRAGWVLTFEMRPPAGVPEPLLAAIIAYHAAIIEHGEDRRNAELDGARRDRLLRAIRELPGEPDPQRYAHILLDTARELTGASGAALATWAEETGTIHSVAGDDGGPRPGQQFHSPQSDMALAARAGDRIVRLRPPAGHAAAIATPDEQWRRSPRSWAAIPLGSRDHINGVLAVWSAAADGLAEEGVEMLVTIAPTCGMQLAQVTDYRRLRDSAERDPLTGLPNRRAFEHAFSAERARAERYGRAIAALMIDIDDFKEVNDRYGHAAGDAVLVAVGRTIQSAIRDVDRAGRVGGEEFAVLLPETGVAAARDVAERLRASVANLRRTDASLPCEVRISVGVSATPECAATAGELLASADAMLYLAKKTGRNRVCDPRQTRSPVDQTPELR